MFDPSSRYANQPIRTRRVHGHDVSYVTRRLIVDAGAPSIGRVIVNQADRVDHLAHRAYGDARQWWRIADGNYAKRADDLTTHVGAIIDVPSPMPPPEAR